MYRACLMWIALLLPCVLYAQIDDGRAAIDRGEYVRAVNILSEEIVERPSPDAYLYLGIAYGHMREFERGEQVLRQGAERYSDDARFFNEIAGLHLAANDVEGARSALREALGVDPSNAYASDLLANIDMSEGNVRGALRSWNESDRPIIEDVLNNGYLNPGHWTIDRAAAFGPGSVLRYSAWRTTERRLFQTGLFSNVGIQVQPTAIPDRYDADIQSSIKTNSVGGTVFNLVRGAPIQTTYFDVWNIGDSGVSFRSLWRWDANRRRAEAGFLTPLPLPGVPVLEAVGIWRSEQWQTPDAGFRFKSTGGRVMLRHIPHYRFEIGAGFEYRNRGGVDNQNTSKVLAETSLRLFDGRYQDRIRAEGAAAHNYRLGTLEWNNRFTLSEPTSMIFKWTLKGGTSRGPVPFDDQFQLGVDTRSRNLLRGHQSVDEGRYGRGPMGTHFGVLNLDLERRLSVLPLFNTFNVPFLMIKGEIFTDIGRTNEQREIQIDIGAGLKFETPTEAVHLIYGHATRDGENVLALYIEKRWW